MPEAQPTEEAAPAASPRRLRALLTAWLPLAALATLPIVLSSCIASPPPLGSIGAAERIDALPNVWHPMDAPVEILWDEHLVPCVLASNETDLAYGLGVVHAHLRFGQMEFIKRVARGRLAEMAGPLAIPIDHGLGALDMDRAVPEIEASLPDETRAWLEAYVAGVNHIRETRTETPEDLLALGIDPEEPWTVGDSLAIGRLVCADLTWGRWLSLWPRKSESGWADFVGRLRGFASSAEPSFGPGEPIPLATLFEIGRSGSNSIVVSGDKTGTGSAMIASDPHLGLPQPNIWMIAAIRGPKTRAVGFTIPGLPFVVEGRNDRIAWGGTNMQNVTSRLVDVSNEDPSTITEREITIPVRWWFDAKRTVRDSAYGPILSDIGILGGLAPDGGDVAVQWRAHEPSDESTAFLLAMRAENWSDFRAAFALFQSGGQNMLYADVDGNVGQVLATESVPAAAAVAWDGPLPPAEHGDWSQRLPSDRLPAGYNPPEGFIVSANNVPVRTTPPLLTQGNANDRMRQMTDRLAADDVIDVEDLRSIQLDVHSQASLAVARTVGRISGTGATPPPPDPQSEPWERLLHAVATWDGTYDLDSTGAVAYIRLVDTLIDALYMDRYGSGLRGTMRRGPYVHDFIREDLESGPQGEIEIRIRQAARAAADGWREDETWGEVHTLNLAHPVGGVPLLGAAWKYDTIPLPGSTTTIAKAAHPMRRGQVDTTFGANARHISDMADPDANWFVLLGGNDGRPGSAHLLDQVEIWQRGELIKLPLTEEGWRARTKFTTTLEPRPNTGDSLDGAARDDDRIAGAAP